MPIIACITAGAGASIRLFGPESMGGIGARIDAETTRTGLSDDEIGPKTRQEYVITSTLAIVWNLVRVILHQITMILAWE